MDADGVLGERGVRERIRGFGDDGCGREGGRGADRDEDEGGTGDERIDAGRDDVAAEKAGGGGVRR